MADHSTCPPLTRASVQAAHARIAPHIHRTPVVTCATIDRVASTPQSERTPDLGPVEAGASARPTIRVFFKCENQQRIGAFKARGAFHALGRLIDERGIEDVRRKGVVTHSSGNHAQALALAARTHGVPAHIVMPTISTSSKIAGTKAQGATVYFSGSTSTEREAKVAEVIAATGATLVPPYDHPDIILGQGTQALELEEQAAEMIRERQQQKLKSHSEDQTNGTTDAPAPASRLDAVVTACGGGGMLSGICTALSGTGIRVFGAEPSFQGANDAERGLAQGRRIDTVKSLTIADGVRTPVGHINWSVISDPTKLAGIYSVTEEQITAALRLAMERAKLFIEPTAAVPLAVVLYNEAFRRRVEAEAGPEGWNVGVVLSGGNTTMEALAKIFAPKEQAEGERAAGKVGADGEKAAENVAG